MSTFAPELDAASFPLADLTAVLSPFAAVFDGTAAGRMGTLLLIHRNLTLLEGTTLSLSWESLRR
jgi:hypothetical protein